MPGTGPGMTAESLARFHWKMFQHTLPHLVGSRRPPRELQIVGDEHEAEAVRPLQFLQQIDDVVLRLLVEIARRLIGEQQARRIDQRAGDGHPALLAARHAAGIGVGAVREADAGDEIVRARIGRFRIHGAAEQRRNGDVVDRGQVRQQAWNLEDESDVPGAKARELQFRQRPDVGAVEQQLAVRRRGQGAEHRHQGRLPRTGPADDRDEFAGRQLEAGVPHGIVARSRAVALGERLRREGHVNALPPG